MNFIWRMKFLNGILNWKKFWLIVNLNSEFSGVTNCAAAGVPSPAPPSPVFSRGGTRPGRWAPATASGQRWWCRSTAAGSRGSSGEPRPGPSDELSSSAQALPQAWGCTLALPPPASSSCPWASAATSPPWSHPIALCWCVSIAHQQGHSEAAARAPSGLRRKDGGCWCKGEGPDPRARAQHRVGAHRVWR